MDRDCGVRETPFRTQDGVVGESKRNTVCGYDKGGLVVKVPKLGERSNVSLEQIRRRLADYREVADQVRSRVRFYGGRDNLVIDESLVVHNSDSGGITFSRVQDRIGGARSLAEVGIGVFGLNRQSLLDLESIFRTNIEFYHKKGALLDLVGSTVSKRSKIDKIFRHLLPVLYSENIVIDGEGNPKLVDMGGLTRIEKERFLTRLRCGLQVIGSYLSIGLLGLAAVLVRK